MVMGPEASVSLCVDALFPLGSLVDLSRDFAREFPAIDLRVDTQSATAVAARVLDGSATIGVMSLAVLPPGLERQTLTPITMVPVVAVSHPFAALKGPIPTARCGDAIQIAIQIVLSERTGAGAADQCVLSTRVWRVADMRTDHEMVRAGLGWSNLPEHIVRDDLQAGRLVAFRPQVWGEAETRVPLFAVFRGDTTFGPARRWILGRLGHLCVRDAASVVAAQTPSSRSKRRVR